MTFRMAVLAALAAACVNPSLAADTASVGVHVSGLKAGDPASVRQALAALPAGMSATAGIHVRAPVQGDLCTQPDATPVNPFTISSTTVGATNNYDIATTCGVTQTLFAGTAASLDVTFGVVTDANCTVTASADPTGTNWDLALFVLQAPGAACTQLPTLADAQCITMDDDGASNTTETVTWTATAGTEYYVIVDGFNAATGSFDLNIAGTGCNLVGVPADADLAITKTDGVTTATPGGSVTYTITASNAGPAPVVAATVADTFPAEQTCTWTCVGAGGGTCTAAGSGNINDSVNLPAGGSTTYTASCTVSAAASGTLSNTATVTAPAGVNDAPGNNSATDTDTLVAAADLAITKTDGVTSVTAGGSTTYIITASNAGPSNAPGATVADTFPAPLTCSWTCLGAGGGTCTAVGSGNINDTVNLPVGGSTTYTASCAVSGAASGTLSNTATVTAPAGVTDGVPGNNSATDTDTVELQADLAIAKTDGVASVVPGGSTTYTITASNAGPSNAAAATVVDTFPADLACTWTCVGAGGGTCTAAGAGNINDTVNLPAGGSTTHTASCTLAATATGTLTNTASVAAPAGVTDSNPGNDSATDVDTVDAQADLSITKTDGVTDFVPGGSLTYTIVAANAGPSAAAGATVTDTFPADLTCTWTCVGAGGGTCTAAGSGNIADSVTLPSGASVTYTASCAVSAAASGTLTNTATVEAPGGVPDPVPGNNSASDTDADNPTADLSISKTDGVTEYVPGGNLTYTIVASNAGPSTATGATVTDSFPVDLTCTWTCAGSGGGTCTAAGAGNIADSVNLPSGGSVTYTAVCAVSNAATGALSNTATVEAPGGVTDPAGGNNSATDTDSTDLQADLSITKTDGSTTAAAGGTLTYTIVASNAGPGDAAATVTDTFPAACDSVTWTCAGSGGGTCPANGSGNIAATVDLPAGGSATFTAACVTAAASPDGTVVSNTATVAVSGGATDPVPGNDSATDTTTLTGGAAISASKTVAGDFAPGGAITYSIVLSNDGDAAQADNPGAEFTDVLPAGITHVSSNATAGTASFAAGTVSWNGTIAAGASVTITIQATVDADATGTIANQGSVQYDADNDGSNETSALTDDPGEAGTGNPTGFEVDEGTVEPPPTGMPAVIPANGLLSLFALTLLLLGIAWRRRLG